MKQVWVVALLLLPMAYAAGNISTSDTTVTIEGAAALISNNMLLSAEDIGNLTLLLTPDYDDLSITIDNQSTDCLVQAEFARCGTLSPGMHTINISYTTTYPVAETGQNTLIRYTDRLPYQAEKQQVTIILPVGYIIPKERGKDEDFYISPKPTDVYSDGQRIIIFWEEKGQELPITVITRKVIGLPLGWIATTALSILVSSGLVIWFVLSQRKAPKPKPARKKAPIVPTLIDKEQRVVEFLKQNGEVWQKQIQTATGFSKAKVSRVIRNLEERGVITKTIYGNTNKIALKK